VLVIDNLEEKTYIPLKSGKRCKETKKSTKLLMFRFNQVKDVKKETKRSTKLLMFHSNRIKKKTTRNVPLKSGERCKERKRCRITAYTKKLKKPH
jgi:hypothetical protein